ncbi:MAG: hypothetical protein FJ146_02700 [Deltaproteobacteria bacterium]|nr:hypothetical protein [Deltaproteobacteria bacterium]
MKRGLFFLSVVASSCAPSLAGRLDSHGQILGPDAKVNITPLAATTSGQRVGSIIISVKPDGTFATEEQLPVGDCLVEALVPGFAVASTHVNLDGSSKKIDLDLRPLPRTSLRASQVQRTIEDGRGAGGANLAPPSL